MYENLGIYLCMHRILLCFTGNKMLLPGKLVWRTLI